MSRPGIDQQITFLYTRDLVATAQFYEQVLGLEVALDQGDCRIYRIKPDAYLGFCQRLNAPESPTGVIITLVTAQVDEWYQHLSRQGIAFEKPPTLNPGYNIYHCFLRDPNGYLIEIQEFRDPRWGSALKS